MLSPRDSGPIRSSPPPELLAGAVIAAGVGLVIVGARTALALQWIGRSDWTKPVLAVGIAFLAAAVALVAQAYRRRRIAIGAGVVILVIAGVRLTHHALGRVWIDQHPALVDAFVFVHRWMSVGTAELLVIFCIGLTAYASDWRSRFGAPVVAALASLLAIACTLQLAMWMVHPGISLGWEYVTELSNLAAVAFLALSVALFGRAWRDGLQKRPAGPVWIPIPIALVLMVASVVLWRALRVEEWGHLQALTQTEVTTIQRTLAVDVQRHMHALARFARRWEAEGYADRALWDADTALQIAQTPSIAAITWADENLIVRWAAQRQVGKQVTGLSLLGETNRRAAAIAARDTHHPAITKPVRFHTDGSSGFLIMAPIYRGDRFGGLVLGAFRYQQLIEPLGRGRGYDIVIADGDTTLYRTSDAPIGKFFHRASVPLDGTTWTITAWPTPELIAREESAFPRIVLGAGLVMALLVALTVRLAQTAARRAHDANHATEMAEAHARTLHAQSEQLAAARDAALSATVAKSAFLATMSHEIRTPMNGVLGTVSLLGDTTLSSEQREYADQIRLSAEHLLRLIDDILDFSKAEAGRLTLETVDLNLRALVEDAADLMAVAAQRKGIEFAVHVEPDVPNDVRGDGVRLRQVLLNLLSNAMKFTSQGIVTLTVSRERFALSNAADAARDLVRFTVTDSGIGISPQAIGRLFESFSQADSSTTRRYGGSGLGLAIARQIAELMGGTIGVTSEVGRGSTFWFTARLAKSAAPLPRAAIDRGDVLAGVRVLIADDQPVSLAGLAEQMRQLGASTVETVSTMGDAHDRLVEAAREHQAFDVAFIDESIAFADGASGDGAGVFDARTFPPGTIALLTTTRSRSSAGERATTIGYRGSVTKPARRRHLEAIVLSALGRDVEARADADAERLKHASGEAIAAAHGHGRAARALRILVAEDNEINQKVIGRMLQKLGHQVEMVVNGLEAVEACARGGYDLVLMDCQMPELDGYDATARIRRQDGAGARIPIVALTADASVADRDRCLAAGMDDFLGKPVRPQELTRAIERWTAHAHDMTDTRQTA